MKKRALRLVAAASCLCGVGLALDASLAAAQAKDVKRYVEMCEGNRLCPWFVADVAPPAGFVADEKFGASRKLLAFFPDKPKLDAGDPLLYVRTTYNGDGRSLAAQAANSNARWKEIAGRADIERLPDIPRADGKGVWLVFRYVNHEQPQQAHELLAFGEHLEKGTQKFFHMAVLTASRREAVDEAQASWRDLLDRL